MGLASPQSAEPRFEGRGGDPPDHREPLRWLGSIGIFYVAIPLWIVLSDPLIRRLLPATSSWHVPWPLRLAAVLPLISGALLAARAMQLQITRGKGHPFDLTGDQPLSRPTRQLLSDDVYRWTRNPMGLGDLLLYGGLALLVDAPRSLAINLPLYALLVWWNHRYNERPALIARFGAQYLSYEATTSCLIPGPKSWRKYHRSG